MKRLTDKEMKAINNAMPPEAKYGDVFKSIAQAQLESCEREAEAELKKVKEEIGKQLGIPKTDKPFQMSITIFSEWWQSYWKGKGVE